MSTITTPQFSLSSFVDHLGCFIGEMEVKTDFSTDKVQFKYYWIFNSNHKKGIEVNPVMSPNHKIVSMSLIGTESRIEYAKCFMNIVK